MPTLNLIKFFCFDNFTVTLLIYITKNEYCNTPINKYPYAMLDLIFFFSSKTIEEKNAKKPPPIFVIPWVNPIIKYKYFSLFFRKVSAVSIIIGLILGVCITIYYQYFAESTLYDLHAGLIGLTFNVGAVFFFSYIYKQSDSEIVKAKEFNEI